jgi:hypothetical protein
MAGEQMRLKVTYLVLCILGAVLPYCYFVPFVAANGLNMNLFLRELFANHISAFFAMDVFVSAVTLVAFIRSEGARMGVRQWWLPLLATLLVGVSLGLPLFLLLREFAVEQGPARAK